MVSLISKHYCSLVHWKHTLLSRPLPDSINGTTQHTPATITVAAAFVDSSRCTLNRQQSTQFVETGGRVRKLYRREGRAGGHTRTERVGGVVRDRCMEVAGYRRKAVGLVRGAAGGGLPLPSSSVRCRRWEWRAATDEALQPGIGWRLEPPGRVRELVPRA